MNDYADVKTSFGRNRFNWNMSVLTKEKAARIKAPYSAKFRRDARTWAEIWWKARPKTLAFNLPKRITAYVRYSDSWFPREQVRHAMLVTGAERYAVRQFKTGQYLFLIGPRGRAVIMNMTDQFVKERGGHRGMKKVQMLVTQLARPVE